MAEDKKSFIMYTSYKEPIEGLTLEERGLLFSALFEYAETAVVPELEGAVKMAFLFIKTQIDRDSEKYEKTVQKRKEAGKKGGRPSFETTEEKANGFFEKQTKAKKANGFSEKQKNPVDDNVNDNDDVNVNDIYTSSTKAEEVVNITASSAGEVFKTYESEIGVVTPMVIEVLTGFNLSDELKVHAIRDASEHNKKTLKYIAAILKRYESEGVKVVADASRGSPKKGDRAEKESNYDFDEIERIELQRRLNGKDGS